MKPERRGNLVIIDSNFLFIPQKFKVDIFEEMRRLLGGNVKCLVPYPVLEELQQLREGAKPSLRRKVDFALSLAERCEKEDLKAEEGETVDDFIVRLASSRKYPVATNDAMLRKRLREKGVPVVFLRKRAHLEIEGVI